MRRTLATLAAAAVLVLGLSAPAAAAPQPAAAGKVACSKWFGCGNYVVDPVSRTGVYCIPDWGWDLAPGGAGTGNGWWKAYVAPGQYASWIPQCQTADGDVDGFWIDYNHRVDVYSWWATSRGGAWIYVTGVAPGQNYKVSDGQTLLLKVWAR